MALGNPGDGLYIPQSTRRVFKIGFQGIVDIMVFLVPTNLLIPFRSEEFFCRPHAPVRVASVHLNLQVGWTDDGPRFHERGSDGDIAYGFELALLDGPDTLTYFQADIPQQRGKGTDAVSVFCVSVPARQYQDVDIGVGQQFTTSITPNRHQGNIFCIGPLLLQPCQAKDLVDHPGPALDDVGNIQVFPVACIQNGAGFSDRFPVQGDFIARSRQSGFQIFDIQQGILSP